MSCRAPDRRGVTAPQKLFIAVPVPPLGNARGKQLWGNAAKRKQQDEVRRQLDIMAARPALPCVVSLTRVSGRRLDPGEGAQVALKYVRDAVARWVHGLPETIPALKDGRPIITASGKLKMTRPPAPDGPNDGIEWRYPPEQLGRVLPKARGQKRAKRECGVLVEIAPAGGSAP